MTTRIKALSVFVLAAIVAAFVAGYWPEHQRRIAAEAESEAVRRRVSSLEDRVRAAQLHGELLNLIDAVEAMNFGEAQSRSSSFFDRVRAEAGRTQDLRLRSVLDEILTRRDSVTSALTRGDAAVAATLAEAERALRQRVSAPEIG